MGAVVCIWILVVTSFCGTSQAYFNSIRPSSFPSPRYDSCRETIEDLKALLEITQSLKPDTTHACPTCSSALSEELIIKLVNALIYTATHNCGFNGKGCGGIPVNHGGGAGGHTLVNGGDGNIGGLIGGGNNIIATGDNTVNKGDNNGGGDVTGGGKNSGGGNPGGTDSPNGGDSDPLVGVHVLDGHSILGVDVGSHSGSGTNGAKPGETLPTTAHQHSDDPALVHLDVLKGHELLGASVGNTKVAEVNLGSSHDNGAATTGHHSDDTPPVIGLNVLKGNELLGASLGNTKLADVTLGSSHNNGGTTGGTPSTTQKVGDGATNGAPGTITNGHHGANNHDVGSETHGSNNSPTSISTATSQVAGVPVTSVPTSAGTGATGRNTKINSDNSSTVQNSTDTVNVLNQPKS